MTDTYKKPTDAELFEKAHNLSGSSKTLTAEEIKKNGAEARKNFEALGYDLIDSPGTDRYVITAIATEPPYHGLIAIGCDEDSANLALYETWGKKQEQIWAIDQKHALEKRELDREIAKAEADEREREDD